MPERHLYGNLKKATLAAVAVLTMAMAILWSWNSLATELFGLGQIQFRHALAILVALFVLRWVAMPGHRLRHIGPDHRAD